MLPSVVDMSGAGIKWIVVMNQEILEHKNKRNNEIFTNAKLFVPSVVDISGAEIKCSVVSNKKED